MSHKARKRPSWKKNRLLCFDRKYYRIKYDKFSRFLIVVDKEVLKEIAGEFNGQETPV
jgi:hypothetical protein